MSPHLRCVIIQHFFLSFIFHTWDCIPSGFFVCTIWGSHLLLFFYRDNRSFQCWVWRSTDFVTLPLPRAKVTLRLCAELSSPFSHLLLLILDNPAPLYRLRNWGTEWGKGPAQGHTTHSGWIWVSWHLALFFSYVRTVFLSITHIFWPLCRLEMKFTNNMIAWLNLSWD